MAGEPGGSARRLLPMVIGRRPLPLVGTALSVGIVTVLSAACGKGATGASTTATSSSTTTTTLAVDQGATPNGWVPVAFGDIQVSVPGNWEVGFGCPNGPGNVYLGGVPKVFCPNDASGEGIVVLDTDTSRPPTSVAAEIINGITVYRLGPDDDTVLLPSVRASVIATGPLASEVIHTLTYSPRAVALVPGASPAVPRTWHRVSFGGLSLAVPKRWAVSHRSDVPFSCGPIDTSLIEDTVILSAGTSVSAVACPATSGVKVPTPLNGLLIDPGPTSPTPADASFGSCVRIDRLRACPVTTDPYGALDVSVHLPGRGRATAVEIGLAGSGMIARTILDSLTPDP